MENEYSEMSDKVDELLSNIIIKEGMIDFEFYEFAKFYFERHRGKDNLDRDKQLLEVLDDLVEKQSEEFSNLPMLSGPTKINMTLADLEKSSMQGSESFYICSKVDNRNTIDRYMAKRGDISNEEFSFRLVDELGLYTDPINVQKQYFILEKIGTKVKLSFTDIPDNDRVVKYVDSTACMRYDNYIET